MGVAAFKGRIYVFGGGVNDAADRGVVEAYDPVTDTWTIKRPMPTPRVHTSVGVIGGLIYVVGGWMYEIGTVATVDAYDPATDTWISKASLPEIRSAKIAVIDGMLYAIGGEGVDGYSLGTVEAYDPATDTWTPRQSMPNSRGAFGIGVINGAIYVAGGANSSDSSFTYLSNLDRYDPRTDTWSERASMPAARFNFNATVVDGVFYAPGGLLGGSFKATLEAYRP
jgi:N-acetylneuraminic acid mutarotase